MRKDLWQPSIDHRQHSFSNHRSTSNVSLFYDLFIDMHWRAQSIACLPRTIEQPGSSEL